MDAKEDEEILADMREATPKVYEEDFEEPSPAMKPLRVELEHISGIRLLLEVLPPIGRSDDAPALAKEDFEEALDALLDVVGTTEFCAFAQTRLFSEEVSVRIS